MSLIRKLISILLLTSCSSGGIVLNNDWGAHGIKNEDKYFTHGSKVYYRDQEDTYALNQNIYTPSKKSSEASKEELENNRPYTGFLNVEYRDYTYKEDSTTVHSYQVGCVGRCSLAKEAQTFVHKTLDQSVPTWNKEYSLKSEPGFIYSWEKYAELDTNEWSYSSLFTRLRAGNIIDSMSGGFIYRLGEGVSERNTETITFKTSKPDFSYYVYTELESRYVLYNALLEGSMFQKERHTVDANPFVFQSDIGVVLKYKNYIFNYSYVFVSDEWEGQGGLFSFGGLNLEW